MRYTPSSSNSSFQDLVVDFNLTPVLHKSRVRKSNVRLGSIDFFFLFGEFDVVRLSNSVHDLSWSEFDWARFTMPGQ